MIGIVAAMDAEISGYISIMENKTEKKISGYIFTSGKIYGKDVVCVKCSAGKVNSAICTEAMILQYNPDIIINPGIAGSLDKDLHIYDVVLAESCVQYDVSLEAFGSPPGMIDDLNVSNFMCDKYCLDIFKKVCKNENYKSGIIASGDTFVDSSMTKEYIKKTFGAVACEMEGASIGHVCFMNDVKYFVLRIISDSASSEDYRIFKTKACDKAIELMKEFIKIY